MTLFILVGGFLLDRLSKAWVLREMSFNQSIPVIPSVFHITLIGNTGIAFGLFQGWGGTFVLGGGVVLGLAYWLRRRAFRDRWAGIGLGLVCGGALGNLLDRLLYGHVVDFLDFRVWPVFNLADTWITVGVVCFVIASFKK